MHQILQLASVSPSHIPDWAARQENHPLPSFVFIVRENHRLLPFVRMQPDSVDRLAVVVEDVLATVVGTINRSRCDVRELAFAELHFASER